MEKNQNGFPVRNGNMQSVPAPTQPTPDSDSRSYRNGMKGKGSSCPDMNGAGGMCHGEMGGLNNLALAYAYVPMQKFRMLYNPETALERGTLFEELDLPLGVYKNGK